jgi:outer membrane protein TolC
VLTLQQQKLGISQQLTGHQKAPKISAFARGGAGYPNPYNFFDDEASPFYMVGARFTWNILDWQQNKREQRVLDIQQDILPTQHENTERQIQLDLREKQSDINRLEKNLEKDQQLVQVQEKVLELVSAQLDNGVISAADYLEEVHAKQTASLNYELHKIQLIKAQYDYLLTQGQLFNQQQ